MRQYIKEIGTHSSIYAVSNILTKAIGVFLIPIYTRFLTVEDYGIISIITPLINAVAILYSFGMRQAYGRFHFDQKDRSKEQKQLLGTILLFVISIGLIGNFIILILGESFFDNIFPEIDFYPFIFLAFWTGLFVAIIEVKLNLYRLRQQSKFYGFLSVLRFLFIVIFTIIAVVFLEMGALGKVASEFIVCLFLAILSGILLIKDIRLSFDLMKFKQLITYALPIVPHAIAGVILGLSAKYFINYYHGLGEAGIFNIALLIGSIMNMVITSINLAWNPFFMRTARNHKASEAKMIFSQLSTYYILFVTFIGLIISLYSEDIIILLTTPDYYRAADFAPIIVMSYVLRGGYYLFVAKIFYVKKAIKLLALVSIISAVLDVILNILLVPRFGMAGSSIAFISSSLLLVLLTYHFSQKAYHIKYEHNRMFKIVMAAFVVLVLYYLLSDIFNSYYLGLTFKTLVLLLFLLYFRYSGFFRKSEIDNLNEVILKAKAKYFKN